jgi:hypothetical protein
MPPATRREAVKIQIVRFIVGVILSENSKVMQLLSEADSVLTAAVLPLPTGPTGEVGAVAEGWSAG